MSVDDQMCKRRLDILRTIAETAKSCGRDPQEITLVAVSKLHPARSVRILAQAGHLDFGENYVQEARDKQGELFDLPLRWHFIGRLQSNKAKYLPGRFHLVHSVDDLKTAHILSKRSQQAEVTQGVLLQVSIAGEAQKGGLPISDLAASAREIAALPGLELQGLMCMPPFFEAPEQARPLFRRLRQERDRLQDLLGFALPHLSMGMSGDYQAAIEEGATLVRIGTSIFGAREA